MKKVEYTLNNRRFYWKLHLKEAFVIQEGKKRLTYNIFIQTKYHFKS